MRKAIISLLITLALSGAAFGATLTVTVRDSAGSPVPNALVAVISFLSTGGPDQSESDIKLTSTDGAPVTFNIQSNIDYMVLVSKQGMSPTIKDQMGPGYPPIRTSGADISITRTLAADSLLNSSSGRVACTVTGLPDGTLVFSDVQNAQTDTAVAFSMAKSASGSAVVHILNVPVSAANTYRIYCGVPHLGLGYPKDLAAEVTAGSVTAVTISSSVFTLASQVDRQDEPSGELSFEGVIVDAANAPIKDCAVALKKKNPLAQDGWIWNNPIDVAEVRTDFSGHFAFYDVEVDSYAVQIGKKGYEGRFISGQNEQGLRPDRDSDRFISEENGKITLLIAIGKISGRVIMWSEAGALPVPNANVNVWSDWSSWPQVASGTATSSGGGYDNYYTTGPARSARGNAWVNTNANGEFVIEGLSHGNFTVAVNSEFIQMQSEFHYNKGANNQYDWNGSENAGHSHADDLRVTVSAVDFKCNVYNSSGIVVNSDIGTNPVDICISTYVPQAGTISGRITFDVPETAINISADSPIMLWAYEQNNTGENQKRYFKAISGAITDRTYDYTVNAATGTRYWLEVRSKSWGVVGRVDMNADLASQDSVTGLNFRMAPAGRLRGIVRLPDGKIFKRTWTQAYEDRIELQVNGTTVDCYGWGDVKDDGYFEITGLIPGTYDLMTRNERMVFSSGKTLPLEWPNMSLSGVKIRGGEEIYLEVQLKNGALVSPKTPSMPPVPAPPSPYTVSNTKYGILMFPSSEGATRDSLVTLLGSKDSYDKNIAFKYDGTSADPWGQRRILPGRYDFILSRVDSFMTGGDGNEEPGDHYCVTVISQRKNVEISYDPLKPNTTAYLEFESGTLGQSELTGTVGGDGTFTQKDVDIITRSGMEKFLTYIPSVMLYDADGQFKGFSMALPLLTRVEQWDEKIRANSFTLDWFKSELANYPLIYRAKRLPAGQYVAVFETPNYPPMIRKVSLASGENTLDVDFDDNTIVGSSLEGVVKSTDNIALGDCAIVLKHRTVNKTIVTGSDGTFSVAGLPTGVYRLSINKPGYAPAAAKFGLGKDRKYFTGADAILLSRSNSSIEGTVYSQKMPMPKVIVGAKIVAYNETYNTQNPAKMLPVLTTKTDEQGYYIIDGMIAGNLYKVYVLASGKLLEWKTIGTDQNPLSPGTNTGMDFVLRALPPRMKTTMTKVYENGRFLYRFIIESPKKIINPSNPASLAAPYCRYSPITSASGAFDAAKAVEVLPNIGPEIANPEGGKIYTYSLKIPVLQDSEYYKLRVEATDGANEYSEDLVFGPKIEARAKKDMKEEIAEGGDITIDDTGTDTTQITVDPGAFTPTGAETSTLSQNNVEIPIGGFLSAMPNFNLSRTGSTKSAAMAKIVESIVASDVYEVALADAQVNKSLSLNLKFDMTKVSDAEFADLQICQFNGYLDKWETVKGAVTVDPISNVVSVDVDSVENASGSSSRSPRAGKSVIRNGMYAANSAASTSQSGVFAVFKQDPASAKKYTGSEFELINFPNPFDLKTKTVTMQDANSNNQQTITGTLFKYSLPSASGGHVKIYIYNLAAELCKEMDEGDREGGYYYYTEWDGKNDNGEECASGVYFALAKIDGKKLNSKPLKIAILK